MKINRLSTYYHLRSTIKASVAVNSQGNNIVQIHGKSEEEIRQYLERIDPNLKYTLTNKGNTSFILNLEQNNAHKIMNELRAIIMN